MSEQLLQQMVNEIQYIKSSMAMKRDLEYMATKDALSSMATKKDLESMANQIDRNFKQIVRNSEKLNDISDNQNRHEKILETLSVRSI
ncbi:hypothetical protein ACW2QC_04295 [Virgibacillus sp. FSP13]